MVLWGDWVEFGGILNFVLGSDGLWCVKVIVFFCGCCIGYVVLYV